MGDIYSLLRIIVRQEKTSVLFSVLPVEQPLTRPLLGCSSHAVQREMFLP